MNILSLSNENFLFKHSLKVMISLKNISISLILSFNFRTQKVSQKMYFCSSWYQIKKLWLLNWKINEILHQISFFSCILQAIRKSRLLWHTQLLFIYQLNIRSIHSTAMGLSVTKADVFLQRILILKLFATISTCLKLDWHMHTLHMFL